MKKIATLLVLMVFGTMFVNAQEDRSRFGATEEDQIRCLEALQIYRTMRDQEGMESLAYTSWQTALAACPCTAGERMLSDGTKFIKAQFKGSDSARKAVLTDSLIMVYDSWIECYPDSKDYPDGKNSFYVTGKKVTDLLKITPSKMEELIHTYKEALTGLGSYAPSNQISGFYVAEFDLLKKYVEDNNVEKGDALKEQMILEFLEFGNVLSTGPNNTADQRDIDAAEKAQGNLEQVFKIIADCDQMIPILEKNIAADPDNIELAKKYLELMNAKGCDDSDFYLMIAEKVCNNEPACDCLFSLGAAYNKKGNNQKALDFLEQATQMCPTGEDGIKYNLAAAQIASNIGSCGTATKYANKVLSLDPNNAEAYFVKGDCAQTMANSCDDGNLGRYCAYWVAADYYSRAKSADPSVASRANQKIANVSVAFPAVDKLFKASAKEGGSFDCGCFGTSTTIRAKN